MSTAANSNNNPQAGKTRQTKLGVVVSDKRSKTRTVAVEYQAIDPKYGKRLRRQGKFHVHDPQNVSKQGDLVEIVSCRPVSKTKSWRLLRVVKASPEPVAITTSA